MSGLRPEKPMAFIGFHWLLLAFVGFSDGDGATPQTKARPPGAPRSEDLNNLADPARAVKNKKRTKDLD